MDALLLLLKDLESVTLKLQEERTQLSDVRGLLDAVIEKFPETFSRLSSTATIIYSHGFESAIVKVQLGKSSAMAGEERASVSALDLPGQT